MSLNLAKQVNFSTVIEINTGSVTDARSVWRQEVFLLGNRELTIGSKIRDGELVFTLLRSQLDEDHAYVWCWPKENVREAFVETFNRRYIDVLSEYSVLERLFIAESIYVTVVKNFIKQAVAAGWKPQWLITKDETFVKEFLS